MSRQNKQARNKVIKNHVTEQHKKGNRVVTPAPKHGKVRRLAGSTNHRAQNR